MTEPPNNFFFNLQGTRYITTLTAGITRDASTCYTGRPTAHTNRSDDLQRSRLKRRLPEKAIGRIGVPGGQPENTTKYCLMNPTVANFFGGTDGACDRRPHKKTAREPTGSNRDPTISTQPNCRGLPPSPSTDRPTALDHLTDGGIDGACDRQPHQATTTEPTDSHRDPTTLARPTWRGGPPSPSTDDNSTHYDMTLLGY